MGLKSFGRDNRGATAIEYGLIAAGLAVAIIAGYQAWKGEKPSQKPATSQMAPTTPPK